jgi:hypothetical protein
MFLRRFEHAVDICWIALTTKQYTNVSLGDICNNIHNIKVMFQYSIDIRTPLL